MVDIDPPVSRASLAVSYASVPSACAVATEPTTDREPILVMVTSTAEGADTPWSAVLAWAGQGRRLGAAWELVSRDGVLVLALAVFDQSDVASADVAVFWTASVDDERLEAFAAQTSMVALLARGQDWFLDPRLDPHELSEAVWAQTVDPPPAAALLAAGVLTPENHRDHVADFYAEEWIREARAPAFARLHRHEGEYVTERQDVALAWHPWHEDRLTRVDGMLACVPEMQAFFGLQDPSSLPLGALPEPDPEAERVLRTYLATVRRLAKSISVNSSGAVKLTWKRGEGSSVDIDAPHEDALTAALPLIRQLMDQSEPGSFQRVYKRLAKASHDSGNNVVGDALKQWRDAHRALLRNPIRVLRHELVAEATRADLGENVRVPFPGVAEVTPEDLIAIYMYGEVLHRAEHAMQVEGWDGDDLLGPLMRQEVRADINTLFHFYGAFAGFVATWLSESDAGSR